MGGRLAMLVPPAKMPLSYGIEDEPDFPPRYNIAPTHPILVVLEEQAHATRLVSLADGYVGYIDTLQAVNTNTGEAPRQYFPASLITTLVEGAELAGQTAQ